MEDQRYSEEHLINPDIEHGTGIRIMLMLHRQYCNHKDNTPAAAKDAEGSTRSTRP